jgi:uncharacterized protein YjbI with pentapeptide repeats
MTKPKKIDLTNANLSNADLTYTKPEETDITDAVLPSLDRVEIDPEGIVWGSIPPGQSRPQDEPKEESGLTAAQMLDLELKTRQYC